MEVSNLTVSFPIQLYIDCCCESCSTRVNSGLHLRRVVSAHLIVHDRGPELFDKAGHLLKIFRLVKESRYCFLLQ